MVRDITPILIVALTCGLGIGAEQAPPPRPDPDEMATQLIAKGDQNGDGMLTLDELKAGFKALRSERESAKSDAASKRETRFEKELANLFAVADTDSSGTLTKAELVKLLTALDQHRQASGGDGPPPPKAADGAPPPPPRGSRSGRP